METEKKCVLCKLERILAYSTEEDELVEYEYGWAHADCHTYNQGKSQTDKEALKEEELDLVNDKLQTTSDEEEQSDLEF